MSFSPVSQSQCNTWFCLHQCMYSYRSGGVLILQKNCSSLLITKVWKQLQSMLMHYFPPSSSPTKRYQREVIKADLWRWTPLLLCIGEINPVQQLPAALAIPKPEQKGHQTLEHALAHTGTLQPGRSGSILKARRLWVEHGLEEKGGLQQFYSVVKRHFISSGTVRAFRIH